MLNVKPCFAFFFRLLLELCTLYDCIYPSALCCTPSLPFGWKKYLVMHFGTFLRSILFMLLNYYQFSSLDRSLQLSCLHFLSLFKFQFVSCSFLKAEKLFSFRVFIGFIWDSGIQSWRYFILIILLYVTICMSLWAFDFIGNFSC